MRKIALVLPLILMVPVSGAQVQWMVLTANKASTCSVQAHPGEQVLGCYPLDTEVLQSLVSSARKGGHLEVPHPSGSFEVVDWEAETLENGAVSVHGRSAGQPHATFQLTALGRTAIGEYQLGDRFYELRPLRDGGSVLLEVERIIDRDTIHCPPVGRIRLIGIDTPERRQQPFGPAATEALTAMTPIGSTIMVEFDVEREDRYDRILGYLWAEGELVNWRLVREGWALLATYPPNVRYTDAFLAAQQAAREDGSGLWAVDGFACEPASFRRGDCG